MDNHHPIHGQAQFRLRALCATATQFDAIQAQFGAHGGYSFVHIPASDGSVIVTQLGHHFAISPDGTVSHADPLLTFAADGRTITAIN